MASYAQFGYAYPSASQLLTSGQTTTSSASPLSGSMSPGGSAASGGGPGALSPGSGGGASGSNQGPPGSLGPNTIGIGPGSNGNTNTSSVTPNTSPCCESGRPLVTDPVTGQSVCSCQYDSARLAALSQYPRGVGVYGTPYPSTDQNPYPSIGVDSGFYSSLSNPYGLKDGSSSADMSAWTSAGLQPTTGYYPYDPALAAYGYGAGYDLAARRKNATRESTATLKAWLNEHKKNPYPTKGEKIMLAIITKMTLTQVSTWFANARRRLKKENKMTWEPKNKTDEDDDAILSDSDEKDKDDMDDKRDDTDIHGRVKSERGNLDDDDLTDDERKDNLHHMHHMLGGNYNLKPEMKTSDCGVPLPASKPKIWSLADTAACKTPPPPPPVSHLQQLHPSHHNQQHWLSGNSSNAAFALPNSARYGPSSAYMTGHCQQGFPDVQTDTPPQTPPNMKLPSVAGNLVTGPPGAQGQCQSGYGSHSGFLSSPSGFGRPSPIQQMQHHQMGVQSHQQDNTAFKPFYKSTSQGMSGGFVAPV